MICPFSMSENYMPDHWLAFLQANRAKDLRGQRKKELEEVEKVTEKKKSC